MFFCSVSALAEILALQAANLYSEGNSFSAISEKMEISKSRVGDLIRTGITSMANNDGELAEAPTVQVDDEQEVPLENTYDVSPTGFDENRDLDELINRTLLIHATPILRKVALNSKVFLQHEYFQKQLGYQGDVGDLLVEALDFYWKEMGFTLEDCHAATDYLFDVAKPNARKVADACRELDLLIDTLELRFDGES